MPYPPIGWFVNSEDVAEFGRRVRKRREECGYTQEQLAQRTGTPRQKLNGVENGHSLPGLLRAHRIAQTLRVSLGELGEGLFD